MKRFIMIVLFFLNLIFSACAFTKNKKSTLSITSWNLQCFFDANTSGTEYPQFIKNKHWNENSYKERLKRLCNSIKQINSDIFVFEEIENQEILIDISNYLEDFKWNQKEKWNYAVFSRNEGRASGSATLSKSRVFATTLHNLSIHNEKEKQPSMRAIIKTKIKVNEENLTLIVNHWKSKAGNKQSSQLWRTWQESQLSTLFEEALSENEKIIACGDFNQDISEFINDEKSILLKKIQTVSENNFKKSLKAVKVFSPWLEENFNTNEKGSYFYKNKFEKIDHFFLSENINLINFELPEGPWCTEEGLPIKYEITSGKGYSDHLPISCTVQL